VAKEKGAVSGSNEREKRQKHSAVGAGFWGWSGGHRLGIGKEIWIKWERSHESRFDPLYGAIFPVNRAKQWDWSLKFRGAKFADSRNLIVFSQKVSLPFKYSWCASIQEVIVRNFQWLPGISDTGR
jgi:hypothetical protein